MDKVISQIWTFVHIRFFNLVIVAKQRIDIFTDTQTMHSEVNFITIHSYSHTKDWVFFLFSVVREKRCQIDALA